MATVNPADRDKWLAVNEDEILRGMTEEEIDKLNFELAEMDPDNCMLPAGLRQPDHTKKEPTGELDRDALLAHLKQEAEQCEDQEELVPFELGKKRGKVYVNKNQANGADGFGGGGVKLDAEIEDALKNASEAELTDLAAILGLHQMMDNEQYYASLTCTDGIANTVGFSTATKCKLPVCDPSELAAEGQNDTNVEETLEKIKNNDSGLTVVNLNNIRNIPIATLKDVAAAMANNSNVVELSMVGTRSSDTIALELAESLKSNKTLQKLNLETNYLSQKGIKSLIGALNESQNFTLNELKIDNQKQAFGPGGEQDIADLLYENKYLIKFSYGFKFPGPRQKAVGAITRNADEQLRRKRVKK